MTRLQIIAEFITTNKQHNNVIVLNYFLELVSVKTIAEILTAK